MITISITEWRALRLVRLTSAMILMPVLLAACSPALMAAGAMVRTRLVTRGDIWMGQRVTIVVELLSPGYFSGTPMFDLPQVPGVVFYKTDERPVLSTETIDGASYAIQRHELAVFPQRAGRVEIPSFAVRFDTREGTAPVVEQRLKTRPVGFEVRLPPGAEGLATLISARNLELKESWLPEPKTAKVGDAFTRTVTFTASNVPAMLFPPFPATQLPGVRVYHKTPQVRDYDQAGQRFGERVDSITYVCERPGQVRLPAVKLTWWDLETRQLKTSELPARTFDVLSNPALASLTSQPSKPAGRILPWRIVVGGGLGMLLLAAIGWWMRPHWPIWWRNIIDFWQPLHLAPLNPIAASAHHLSAHETNEAKNSHGASLFRTKKTHRRTTS